MLELDERDRLTVDRDIHVLDCRLVPPPALDLQLENVLPVRGKDVGYHHAAPRTERCAFEPVPGVLRHPGVVHVLVCDGRGSRVPHRQSTHLGRRPQKRIEECWRQRLGSRLVVKGTHPEIGGEPFIGVHIQRQQVADHAFVLGSAEPRKPVPTQPGGGTRRSIHHRLQHLHQCDEGITGRARHPRRRHHSGAQLPDHPLRGFGPLRRPFHVKVLKRQVPDQQLVVVTDDTVLTHDLCQGRRPGSGE